MSNSQSGNAPAAPQDLNENESNDYGQNAPHDPGPAESAAEAAAIMGFGGDNSDSGTGDAANTAGQQVTAAASGIAGVAAPIVDQAKQQAQKVVEHTQRAAGEAIGQAREKTKGWIETQLDAAADSLNGMAGAVRDTGQQLREHDPGGMAPIADAAMGAADAVANVSTRLRDATVEDIIRDTEAFARRQPGIFIGGVFVLGFMLARFLKSSSQSQSGSSISNDRLLPVPLESQSDMGG